jgi:hypothetical protein
MRHKQVVNQECMFFGISMAPRKAQETNGVRLVLLRLGFPENARRRLRQPNCPMSFVLGTGKRLPDEY